MGSPTDKIEYEIPHVTDVKTISLYRILIYLGNVALVNVVQVHVK